MTGMDLVYASITLEIRDSRNFGQSRFGRS